ncbi:flagellar assembly peptidoglycan hydrolase FlgJ [Paludibacterium paludis]|uniref:Peptidoglycan hydrolase FlgJ n=1 Tax=Paludibacterium paludis TaxID=1225769 RepID=A0A918NZB0_9NEIS|nr:flagellar assembly peptidoglycan hydrolase FlgJ [Paludibacterium paludis]GGY06631.1 flagellar rod assembly protein FlgJ [Paludibacterium paludis]
MSTQFTAIDNLGSLSSSALAMDPNAVASSLQGRMQKDPRGAVKEVAKQFEAMFLDNVMRAMRATHFNDEEDSSEMSTWRGMLDQQWSQAMSASGGVGLADVLSRQIARLARLEEDGAADARVRTSGPSGMLPQVTRRALAAYGAALPKADAGAPAAAAAPSAESSAAARDPRSFLGAMLAQAREAAAKLGVAPEFVVAHAALESGWGKRAIRMPDGSDSHNLFGIKAGSEWTGKTVDITTTEYVNGTPRKQVEKFRAYDSYREAFSDYANLLSGSARYRNVLNQGQNIAGFAQGLQQGGYATDPRYARKLADVVSTLARA